MSYIITTSELQKTIGQVSKSIDEKTYIVTSRGKGRMVVLPYFDGCEDWIQDYLEDYEMRANKENLRKVYKRSIESGDSDLVV